MDNYSNNSPKGMRLIFGIFMILVYLAMGRVQWFFRSGHNSPERC